MRETAAGLQKKHLLFVDRLLFLYLFPVWKGGSDAYIVKKSINNIK